MAARVEVTGIESVRSLMRAIGPKTNPKWVRGALVDIGYAVQTDATTNQIIRGGLFRESGPGPRVPSAGNQGQRGKKRKGKLVANQPDDIRVTSRTGALRSSIAVNRSELSRFRVTVVSDLVYAGVHEFGYKTTRARPYLSTALAAVDPDIPRYMVAELDRAIRQAGNKGA